MTELGLNRWEGEQKRGRDGGSDRRNPISIGAAIGPHVVFLGDIYEQLARGLCSGYNEQGLEYTTKGPGFHLTGKKEPRRFLSGHSMTFSEL